MRNKRWDVCLMNPPYSQGLHLKFLDKVIKLSDKSVTIEPTPWINVTAKYNQKSQFNKHQNIIKHLKDLEIISMDDAEKMFGAAFTSNVGIYVCDNNGGYNIEKLITNTVVDKVLNKMPKSMHEVLKYDEPKSCIIFSRVIGGNNGRSNYCYDVYGNNYKLFIYDKNGKRLDNGLTFYENRLKTAWGNVKPKKEQLNIKFNTEQECINFFNYTKTYIFRYMVNKTTMGMELDRSVLPYMEDYTHEWTDEMLYKYFNITNEEQKDIENYIDIIREKALKFEEEQQKNKKRKRKNNV